MAIDIKKFIVRFIEEARDHINQLNDGLATLEAGSSDSINTIFRSAHTIKGSSRMLKLSTITETAHKLEDVMGGLRDGNLQFTPPLGQLLYRTVDALSVLVDKLAETSDGDSLPPPDAALCGALAQAAAGQPRVEEIVGSADSPATPPDTAAVAALPTPLVAASPVEVEVKLKTAETVRVRLSKLDELIKLMGEVVSSHARLRQRLADLRVIEREMVETLGETLAEQAAAPLRHFARALKDDVQAQEMLMNELHDKMLLMRMLSLTIVFEPAARLVRELARSIGKQVECVVGRSRYAEKAPLAVPRITLHDHALVMRG